MSRNKTQADSSDSFTVEESSSIETTVEESSSETSYDTWAQQRKINQRHKRKRIEESEEESEEESVPVKRPKVIHRPWAKTAISCRDDVCRIKRTPEEIAARNAEFKKIIADVVTAYESSVSNIYEPFIPALILKSEITDYISNLLREPIPRRSNKEEHIVIPVPARSFKPALSPLKLPHDIRRQFKKVCMWNINGKYYQTNKDVTSPIPGAPCTAVFIYGPNDYEIREKELGATTVKLTAAALNAIRASFPQ